MQFNPSLWFVCKLCRESFPDTDKLKAHKLQSHLEEILNIKCIVFEEKLLDHEWILSPPKFPSKQDQLLNLNCALLQESNEDDLTDVDSNPLAESRSHTGIEFKNPYVSLKILKTVERLNSTNFPSAVKINTAWKQSTIEQSCHFELGKTSKKILTKRKQDFASKVSPNSPLPKRRKTGDTGGDDDDVQKTKIRELLSNVVLIKSESSDDADGQACLESQDFPISILSTYSLPSNPSASTSAEKPETNSVNGNSSFSSQQKQPHYLPLFTNSAPTQPTGPREPTSESPLKVEFIDYEELIAQNPNVEMIYIESKEAQKMLLLNNDLQLPLESGSDERSGPGTRRGDQSNKIIQNFLFNCQICTASFNTRGSLIRHALTHSQNKPYLCPHCDSNFKTRSNLRVHIIARHGGASPFRCQCCDKSLPSKHDLILISHEAVHTGARPYKSDFPNCGAEVASRTTLYVHKRTVHREELGHEEFPCPICGKIFGLRCFVTKHQRRAHPNQNQVMEILS